MINSVGHPHARSWRSIHLLRHHRAIMIMMVVIGVAAVLFTSGYFDTVDWRLLIKALVETTYRLVITYLISLILGIGVGLLIGWSPFSEFLFPFFDVLQNIPSFALLPLFIYVFGYSNEMIVFFAVTSMIWPILFAILTAIKNTHHDLNNAATIFGAIGWKRVAFYLTPLSIPAILTGSIVSIAIGWETVIGAEIITNMAGFGEYIREASSIGVTQEMVAGTIAILLLVFIVNRIVWAPLLDDSARRYAE